MKRYWLLVVLALCGAPSGARAELSDERFEELDREYKRILFETNKAIDGLFNAGGEHLSDLPPEETARRIRHNQRMFEQRFNERRDFLLNKYGVTLEEYNKAKEKRLDSLRGRRD